MGADLVAVLVHLEHECERVPSQIEDLIRSHLSDCVIVMIKIVVFIAVSPDRND